MAKIVEPPPAQYVKCSKCLATIEYLPEDILVSFTGHQHIKCPRPDCRGYSYFINP